MRAAPGCAPSIGKSSAGTRTWQRRQAAGMEPRPALLRAPAHGRRGAPSGRARSPGAGCQPARRDEPRACAGAAAGAAPGARGAGAQPEHQPGAAACARAQGYRDLTLNGLGLSEHQPGGAAACARARGARIGPAAGAACRSCCALLMRVHMSSEVAGGAAAGPLMRPARDAVGVRACACCACIEAA
jgi:hypothetical protein